MIVLRPPRPASQEPRNGAGRISDRPAAIHDDRLTGHVVAVGSGQEGQQSSDIPGCLRPTKGHGADKCVEGLALLGRSLDSPKHALGICGMKLVDLFLGDGGDGIDRRDTGIVDHDVQRTKLCHGVGYGGKEPDRVC